MYGVHLRIDVINILYPVGEVRQSLLVTASSLVVREPLKLLMGAFYLSDGVAGVVGVGKNLAFRYLELLHEGVKVLLYISKDAHDLVKFAAHGIKGRLIAFFPKA